LYFKSNDFGNSEKWLKSAVDKVPENPNYFDVFPGDAYIARKMEKSSKKINYRIKVIDPDHGLALDLKRQKAGL